MAAPQVWARRDGHLTSIAAAELVPGDLVRVEAGDRVVLQGDLGHVPETLVLFVTIRVYWHIVRSIKKYYFDER